MTNILRLSIILALVTVVAAFVLAEIYSVTKPLIEMQKQAKTQEALRIVLPNTEIVEAVIKKVPVKDGDGNILYNKDEVEYYKGYLDPDSSEVTGYAFKAFGQGYSSLIETMVGIDKSGKIKKIKIIYQKETPGLGAKCEESDEFTGNKWSTEQFSGISVDDLKVDKDGGSIVSITGSTITSRAITHSIRDKMQKLLPKLAIKKDSKSEDT